MLRGTASSNTLFRCFDSTAHCWIGYPPDFWRSKKKKNWRKNVLLTSERPDAINRQSSGTVFDTSCIHTKLVCVYYWQQSCATSRVVKGCTERVHATHLPSLPRRNRLLYFFPFFFFANPSLNTLCGTPSIHWARESIAIKKKKKSRNKITLREDVTRHSTHSIYVTDETKTAWDSGNDCASWRAKYYRIIFPFVQTNNIESKHFYYK